MRRRGPYVVFLSTVAIAFAWSAIRPRDYAVWLFELAALHFVILACGAKYTYAEMPLFNGLRDALSLSRNHFDRVGHLAQGFIPAICVRE